MKQKHNNILIKQDEILIDRDDVNAKCKKIINLFNKTLMNKANEKKNNNVEFKLKKKNSKFRNRNDDE